MSAWNSATGSDRRRAFFVAMRATDPLQHPLYSVRDPWPWAQPHEAAGLRHTCRQQCSCVAARCVCAASGKATDYRALGLDPIHTMDRKLSAGQPCAMDDGRPLHLLRAMSERRMRPADGRCQARQLAARSTVVGCRLAFRLQGLLRRISEHHPELARHAEP